MLAVQGDIAFQSCDLPSGDRKQINTGIIAEGEATGHHHRISQRHMKQAFLYMIAGKMYLEAKKQIDIVHEEHNTVTLSPGTYLLGRQQEYTPSGWRQVAD